MPSHPACSARTAWAATVPISGTAIVHSSIAPYSRIEQRSNQTPFEVPRYHCMSLPKTKWGDRVQRRADILDAARACIAGPGYLALNMRDLAAAAGVSPATLYSYFANKEELFATLYAEAIRGHTDTLRSV